MPSILLMADDTQPPMGLLAFQQNLDRRIARSVIDNDNLMRDFAEGFGNLANKNSCALGLIIHRRNDAKAWLCDVRRAVLIGNAHQRRHLAEIG